MRSFRLFWCAAFAVALLAACSGGVPSEISGKWRSEKLSLGAISLPIAPNIEFSRNSMLLDKESSPVDSYEKAGNQVTVNLASGASLTFQIESPDSLSFAIPFLGPIIYHRVK